MSIHRNTCLFLHQILILDDLHAELGLPSSEGECFGTVNIDCPQDLVDFETTERRLSGELELVQENRLLIIGKGKAPHPLMTRFGGIPSWPRGRDWPRDREGVPMTFLGQINFLDSSYLFRQELPGHLLCVFMSNRTDSTFSADDLSLVWWFICEVDCKGAAPPKGTPVLPEFYAVLYDSYDFLYRPSRANKSASNRYNSSIAHCGKISGLPSFIQSATDSIRPIWDRGDVLLAQIKSIRTRPSVKFPWVNRSKPYGAKSKNAGVYARDNAITLWDDGCLYIFLRESGEIYTQFESH